MRRRISRRVVLRGGCHFDPKTLAGPGAEVDVFAAFATKRARRVGGGVNAIATALGASDDARFQLGHDSNSSGFWVDKNQVHKVSSKLASAVVGFRRPSVS